MRAGALYTHGRCGRLPVTACSPLASSQPTPSKPVIGRVLCVEDDDVSYELVAATLGALLPLVHVHRATTVAEAVSLARKLDPHLVLLDLHLPDAYGLEFIRECSREIGAGAFDVVVVTADLIGPDVAKARALGARSVIFKPVNVPQLVTTVQNSLARRTSR